MNGISLDPNILLQNKIINWFKEKAKTPLLNRVLELSLLNSPSSEGHISLIRPHKFANLASLERSSDEISIHIKNHPKSSWAGSYCHLNMTKTHFWNLKIFQISLFPNLILPVFLNLTLVYSRIRDVTPNYTNSQTNFGLLH